MKESNPIEQPERWVTQAQAGDLGAFEALVNLYDKRIYHVAFQLLQNREDAEDVLQETFLKALENLKRFRQESSFYTWIVRIAVNAALKRLQRGRRTPTVSLDTPPGTEVEDYRPKEIAIWEEDPEKIYSQRQIEQILSEAIASLPVIYRTVFWLKDVENIPVPQIAETLEISLPAAKSRLIRARLALREQLGKHFRKKGAQVYSGEHSHG